METENALYIVLVDNTIHSLSEDPNTELFAWAAYLENSSRNVRFEKWTKNIDYTKVSTKTIQYDFKFNDEYSRIALMKWCQKGLVWHSLIPDLEWVDA
jgi:hypothetical protein